MNPSRSHSARLVQNAELLAFDSTATAPSGPIASDRPVSVGAANGGGPRRINHPRRDLARRILEPIEHTDVDGPKSIGRRRHGRPGQCIGRRQSRGLRLPRGAKPRSDRRPSALQAGMPDKVLADRETQEGQVKSLRNGRHIVTRPAFRNLAIAAEQSSAFHPLIICAKMPQCRDERRNCYTCSDGRLLSVSKQHHTSEPIARQLEFWADCLWLGHASRHQQFGRESALWPRSAPQVRS